MIDFAFTIYLPEERSISDLKCAIVFANAFTSAMESREIINDFNEYCITLFKRFGDKVKYWVSLNEQNV